MDNSVRRAYDAARSFDRKAFHSGCYAPFVSLYFTTVGNVLACCKNDTFLLGNVTTQRLPEIWNGRKIKTLREALMKYRFEAGCEFCEWQIAEGNYGAFPSLFEEFSIESAGPEWPAMIEFAGSNTCNFECIMCCGELSSSIRAHRDGLPPLPRYYSEQFFEDLSPFLSHLKRAKFLGGEPFLASETHRIWSMMIEQKLAVQCHVTTNASQYNAQVERVLDSLPISLTVSLDGITKETLESIRVKSNFEEVLQNLHRFRDHTRKRNTFFSIAFCLMRQNWHEFVDILLFAEQLDCDVFVNTVINPSFCSLYTLPGNEIHRIANEIEKKGSLNENGFRRNVHVWKDAIGKLRGKSKEGQSENVKKIIDNYYTHENHWTNSWRLANNGFKKEALEEIRKIQKGDPFYYQSIAYAADIQRDLGLWTEAEQDLQRAFKISTRRPEAFLYLAKLRLDQNRMDEAIQNALRARDLVKKEDAFESEIYESLVRIYARQGNFSEATRVLNDWLNLDPHNEDAMRLTRELTNIQQQARPTA